LFVPDGQNANYIIVVARTSESDNEKDGLSLFIVDAKSPGIKITPLETVSGDKQAEILFADVTVPSEYLVGDMDNAWPSIEKIIQKAAVARCAEMTVWRKKHSTSPWITPKKEWPSAMLSEHSSLSSTAAPIC
jgi:alkylation response protein AidB-like acyl-CoA dehydrogenase